MDVITLSKAKVHEAQIIRKLEEKVWEEEVVNKYDASMLVWFGYVYVAKIRGKIVGAIISYQTNDNEVFISDWVVDEDYRGMGIGLKLYKRLIRDTKGKSIVSFIETRNTPSLNAHIKLGFHIVKKVKNAYNLDEGYRFFVRRPAEIF